MNNKHLTTIFIAALLCMLCSCNHATQPTTLSTDSVVSIKAEGNNMECKITADYPNSDDSLSHSVAAYINGELARLYLPIINGEDNKQKYPAYNGEPTDGKAVADFYTSGTLEYMKAQAKELKEAGMKETPSLSYELAVRKTADNDRYVSYETTAYAFLGGAHGSAVKYTANIAKPSGTVLAQTVDTLQTKALQPILRKGVLGYLHENGDSTVTDKTLGETLFIENGIIPMPAHAPYLADDGVHFVYQQYEIGPYAMGMVEFTVPYTEIKPYLTKEALTLVKQDQEKH